MDQYALPANMAGDENELTEITVDSARFWLQSNGEVFMVVKLEVALRFGACFWSRTTPVLPQYVLSLLL